MNILTLFAEAMRAAGIPPPADLVADGKVHRFRVEGDRSSSPDGWYILHADGIPCGLFGSWKTGVTHRWCSKSKCTMSTAERSAHRKQMATATAARKRALEKRRAEARKRAAAIWVSVEPAPTDYPYLARKNVQGHGIRVHNGKLVMPLHDHAGTLQSLQFILPDGKNKRFLTGGRTHGCYYPIGKPDGVLVVAEGFATGATIYEATGHAVAITFSAGNLEPVAKALRKKLPDIQLIIAADNDQKTPGNPGVTAGRKAAEAVNAALAIPEFKHDQSGGDWNDYASLHGLDAVREAFEQPAAVLAREQLPGGFIYIGFKTVFVKGGHAILQFRHVSTGKVVEMWFNVILGDYRPGPKGKFNISETHKLHEFMHRLTGLPKQPCRVNQRLSWLKNRNFYGVAEYRGSRWHLGKDLSEAETSHFCKNARKTHDPRTQPVGGSSVGGSSVGGTEMPNPIKQQEFPENIVRAERADEACALLPPKNPNTKERILNNSVVKSTTEDQLIAALEQACQGLTLTAKRLRIEVDDENDISELISNPDTARCFAASVAARISAA